VADALRAAGVLLEPGRKPLDMKDYLAEAAEGCFICRLVQGDPMPPAHHVVWRSEEAIAFLNRFPTTHGSTLVAPTEHYEQVSGDASLQQYLSLQRIVYAVAEAVRQALQPERVYILSLGSQRANAHVHWHIVPCPPGLAFEEQQLALLDTQARGVLVLAPNEAERLVKSLQAHLPGWMRERIR
jgi:diadenosine tetraphosphate (Ap4A) HIT family hydrolase